MPVSLKTQAERTAKTPATARRARVGGLCGFPDTAERVPAESPKTGRCTAVRSGAGTPSAEKERLQADFGRGRSRKRRSRRKA